MTFLAFLLMSLWLLVTGFQTIASSVEQPPLVYQNQPFPVVGSVYEDGLLHLRIERCNTTGRTFDFEFVRVLQSEEGSRSVLLNNDRSIALAQPNCTSVVTNLQLPDNVEPGRYRMIGIITAPGQFRHEFKIPYSSEPFDILPKEALP